MLAHTWQAKWAEENESMMNGRAELLLNVFRNSLKLYSLLSKKMRPKYDEVLKTRLYKHISLTPEGYEAIVVFYNTLFSEDAL